MNETIWEIPEGEALEATMAKAYQVYQKNIRFADATVYEITKGAREGRPEGELLALAMQALDGCQLSMDDGSDDRLSS